MKFNIGLPRHDPQDLRRQFDDEAHQRRDLRLQPADWAIILKNRAHERLGRAKTTGAIGEVEDGRGGACAASHDDSGPSLSRFGPRRGRRGVSEGPRRRRRDPTRVYVVVATPSSRCHVGPFPVHTIAGRGPHPQSPGRGAAEADHRDAERDVGPARGALIGFSEHCH